jgi:hypothetical protein
MAIEPKVAANIHEAIAAVYSNVGYVQKERKASLNYSFAGEAALIEALRPEMVKNGIYVQVSSVRDVEHEIFTSAKGAIQNRTCLVATMRFTHAPSGTFVDVEAAGEGMDSGDKSTPKALTCAYKYALRQTFCIQTGDDPDEHSSFEQERAAAQQQPRPAPNWMIDAAAQLKAWDVKASSIPEIASIEAPDIQSKIRIFGEQHPDSPFESLMEFARKVMPKQEAPA